MSHQRADDHDVKVVREIPLWGLIGVLGLVAVQAIGMFVSLQLQGAAQATFAAQMAAQTEQIKQLIHTVGQITVKDVEHDMKILDHERRMQAVERMRDRGAP